MAAMYEADTPSRLLKRVQQLEDMELPSLPSFQHDDDLEFDSSSMVESSNEEISRNSSHHSIDEGDMATPHPLRKSFIPPSLTSSLTQSARSPAASSVSSSNGSPYPPIQQVNPNLTPSPYTPGTALTSTPQTAQTLARSKYGSSTQDGGSRRGSVHSREFSDGSEAIKSPVTGSEHSGGFDDLRRSSMSGDERSSNGSLDGSSEHNDMELPSLPQAYSPETSIASADSDEGPVETPFARRLSTSNVVISRRGKQSISTSFQPLQTVPEIGVPSPIQSVSEASTPSARSSPLLTVQQDRIPSLSHSEVSATDRSEGGSTPEAPSRMSYGLEISERAESVVNSPLQDWSRAHRSHDDSQEDQQDYQYEHSEVTELEQQTPGKPLGTPYYSTPGTARVGPIRAVATPMLPTPRPGLTDITYFQQNTPSNMPFTPSPASVNSKMSDVSTPRAPLNDAERRKSHVLAVLSSSGLPQRVYKQLARGTPHPLRRAVTAPPETPSDVTRSPHPESLTPGQSDVNDSQAQNESFVSVASSADLTSDRRASAFNHGLSRGNTSFPNILLPTTQSSHSPAASSRGFEHRADGIKIHKHLNAMNKQLLEANADLAREAESWREEVDRLHAILKAEGLEVSVRDAANRSTSSSHTNGDMSRGSSHVWDDKANCSAEVVSRLSAVRARQRSATPGDRQSEADPLDGLTTEEHAAVIQEMAERLEAIEIDLDQKDQVIADLQAQLADKGDMEQSERVTELEAELAEMGQSKDQLQKDFAAKTEQHATQFGEICASFEAQVKTLEASLKSSKADVERLRAERARVEEKEDGSNQVNDSNLVKHLEEVESQLQEAQDQVRLQALDLETQRKDAQAKAEEGGRLQIQVEDLQAEIEELKAKLEDAEAAVGDMDEIRAQLDDLQAKQDNESKSDTVASLERINQDLEAQVVEQDEEIQQLATRLQELEDEMGKAEEEDKAAEQKLLSEIDRLNQELDSLNGALAEKEVELDAAMAKASQGQNATREGSEVVEELERDLEEAFKEIGKLKYQLAASPNRKSAMKIKDTRIRALENEKAILSARLATYRERSTDMSQLASPLKSTPLLNKTVAGLRAPRTPGPLQEFSWLQTTIGDANEPELRAQVEYLQRQLNSVNEHLDANFSRLEAAGMGGVQLAEELAYARDRIAQLEDELHHMAQRNNATLALASAQRDEADSESKTALKEALRAVHSQVAALQQDLEEEKARLKRKNDRLSESLAELQAQRDSDDNAQVQEMSRRIKRLADEVDSTRESLSTRTRERDAARRELRSASETISSLESKVSRLQREQQQRLDTQSQNPAISSRELSQLKESLHRAESDADRLRSILNNKETARAAAEATVAKLQEERQVIMVELLEFEKDLENHRKESKRFATEIQLLKFEQKGKQSRYADQVETLQRDASRSKERLTEVETQLKRTRQMYDDLLRVQDSHQCQSKLQPSLDEQKARFKVQAQDLAVQIRYLKAKFTRESTFRNALSLQKRYLLLLVGGMSLNEQATLKAIASMGFPTPEPVQKTRSLKSVGIAVLSMIRAKKAAKQWRAERQRKEASISAREERKLLHV